jgi:predicted transcriptional regulator
MDHTPGFGKALRQHRVSLGLTQAQLAERAGLSQRAISDLERGLKHPQRATLRLLIWRTRARRRAGQGVRGRGPPARLETE